MGRVRLDPSIISRAVGENVPLNDLASVYQNAQMFHSRQQEYGMNEEKIRQQQTMNEAYKAATNPDGSIDNGRLQAYLAQNSVGTAIPGIQKANMELRKTAGEVKNKDADTDKTLQANLYEGLKLVDNSLASLISRPDVDERMVYGEMARLVNAGAFNIQAKQTGTTPDEYMKNLLSTMPVGNPEQLKSWLVQQGSRVVDATKRYEMSLPKYDEQDRGGALNEGTINQMTGQRTAGINVAKSNTPGEALSAQVTREGQRLTDARGREMAQIQRDANAINKEATASQIVETPQGYQVVNKGTANARPVAGPDNQPLLGKDSEVAKNARMADRLTGMIPYARQLLQGGATSSGAGALADKMLAFTGNSTKGGDAASALETVSGWMTSNVPRFEGPQSDKDTATYRTMAGIVGDRTQPMTTRMQALDAVEQLMQPYMGNRGDIGPFSGPPGTQPPAMVAPRPLLPQGAPVGGRGMSAPMPGQAPAGGRPPLDSFYRK